jgi:hypothetical protein
LLLQWRNFTGRIPSQNLLQSFEQTMIRVGQWVLITIAIVMLNHIVICDYASDFAPAFSTDLCSNSSTTTFPSWCRYNNPLVIPLLLTDKTYESELNEYQCEGFGLSSSCKSMSMRIPYITNLHSTLRYIGC